MEPRCTIVTHTCNDYRPTWLLKNLFWQYLRKDAVRMRSWFAGASGSANLRAGLGGRRISKKSPKMTDRTAQRADRTE
jgi:hypothetical protein